MHLGRLESTQEAPLTSRVHPKLDIRTLSINWQFFDVSISTRMLLHHSIKDPTFANCYYFYPSIILSHLSEPTQPWGGGGGVAAPGTYSEEMLHQYPDADGEDWLCWYGLMHKPSVLFSMGYPHSFVENCTKTKKQTTGVTSVLGDQDCQGRHAQASMRVTI